MHVRQVGCITDHFMQARMQQEQQRLRAEHAAHQAAELAARQKAAEMEAARQAIAIKVPMASFT